MTAFVLLQDLFLCLEYRKKDESFSYIFNTNIFIIELHGTFPEWIT